MKNLKHYSFVFSNNNGDTVTTMMLATPVKIDVFERGISARIQTTKGGFKNV